MRGIVWFREDLRTHDNTALHHAARHCDQGIIGVYLIDTMLWKNHHVAACRVDFLLRGVAELSFALKKLNIPLWVRAVTHTDKIAGELYKIAQSLKAHAVFFNHQHEVNEWRRDQTVRDYLSKHGIDCFSYNDQTILPPGRVLTQQGDYFSVFTPYKRAWQRCLLQEGTLTLLPAPKKQADLGIPSDPVPLSLPGFKPLIDSALWPAGETYARKRLTHFIAKKIFSYEKQRDFPALDGTSQLSPYLAAGMLSARECFAAAMLANHQELDTGNPGALTWMNELIWRDFYKHILVAVPRVSMHQPFKQETEKLPWHYDEAKLIAWKEGKTGFPFVDAGMRQLNTLGWMHNRLRMVVAMFFSKNLFFDWRIGEDYFMSRLIDGDLSANNGGWQWSASTGTDAAPYFRVFNPIRQSQRFDPTGEFIRRYCPELKDLDNKKIHSPPRRENYPAPIVNLEVSRKQVMDAFKKLTA